MSFDTWTSLCFTPALFAPRKRATPCWHIKNDWIPCLLLTIPHFLCLCWPFLSLLLLLLVVFYLSDANSYSAPEKHLMNKIHWKIRRIDFAPETSSRGAPAWRLPLLPYFKVYHTNDPRKRICGFPCGCADMKSQYTLRAVINLILTSQTL